MSPSLNYKTERTSSGWSRSRTNNICPALWLLIEPSICLRGKWMMKIAKPIPYSPTFKGGFAGVAGRAVTAIALSMFNAPFTVEAEESKTMTPRQNLSTRQEAIPTIAAFTAMGNLPQLNVALKEGLDAELTISETKEILVQMYAYTGFPRSLNALAEFMNVLAERKQQGITDESGREPMPVPSGAELLALGTANQTQLAGAPVKGAL